MPSFTASDVKRLRDMTGAGMMDAKKALDEAEGDFAAATKGGRGALQDSGADLGALAEPAAEAAVTEEAAA